MPPNRRFFVTKGTKILFKISDNLCLAVCLGWYTVLIRSFLPLRWNKECQQLLKKWGLSQENVFQVAVQFTIDVEEIRGLTRWKLVGSPKWASFEKRSIITIITVFSWCAAHPTIKSMQYPLKLLWVKESVVIVPNVLTVSIPFVDMFYMKIHVPLHPVACFPNRRFDRDV